jgi:hypothetical protein
MAAAPKQRASRRLAGAPNSTRTRRRARASLDTFKVDELLMVSSHLRAKDMARLEAVCKALGGKAHRLDPSVEDGLSTVMELAAKRSVEATDASVSFRPNEGESWKRLLSKIEKFEADRYVDRPRHGRGAVVPQYGRFSKSFVREFAEADCTPINYYESNQHPDDAAGLEAHQRQLQETIHKLQAGNEPTKAPTPELMEYLERAVTAGSAAAQYALACHCEIGAGVPQDRARARDLYQASADQGCSLAAQALS